MFTNLKISCLVLLLLVFLVPATAYSQNLYKTIEDLEVKTQKELDKGVNMLDHQSALYVGMDSILNVAYNNLRSQLAANRRNELKTEQLAWLKKRDAYFKQLYKDTESETGLKKDEWGEVEYLGIYLSMVEFVKDRCIVLIKAATHQNEQK